MTHSFLVITFKPLVAQWLDLKCFWLSLLQFYWNLRYKIERQVQKWQQFKLFLNLGKPTKMRLFGTMFFGHIHRTWNYFLVNTLSPIDHILIYKNPDLRKIGIFDRIFIHQKLMSESWNFVEMLFNIKRLFPESLSFLSLRFHQNFVFNFS